MRRLPQSFFNKKAMEKVLYELSFLEFEHHEKIYSLIPNMISN